jgi:hypothetical protein
LAWIKKFRRRPSADSFKIIVTYHGQLDTVVDELIIMGIISALLFHVADRPLVVGPMMGIHDTCQAVFAFMYVLACG